MFKASRWVVSKIGTGLAHHVQFQGLKKRGGAVTEGYSGRAESSRQGTPGKK